MIGRGGTVLDGRIDIGLDRRWRALSKRRPDSSVIIFQITGRLGLCAAAGFVVAGRKMSNLSLGACVSRSCGYAGVIQLCLSFQISIFSLSNSPGRPSYGSGTVSGRFRWMDIGWIRFTPLKRMSDGSFQHFESWGI